MSNTLILRLCAIILLLIGGYNLIVKNNPVYGFGYLNFGTSLAILAQVYSKE